MCSLVTGVQTCALPIYKRALTLSAAPVIDVAAFLDRSRFLHMRSCYSAASVHGREGEDMRKVRDYDAELRALGDKARTLKAKKVQQLGELVTSTGADALDRKSTRLHSSH